MNGNRHANTRQLKRTELTAQEPASFGPLILLAPPRSFTSVVTAMLGQHPQLYGLPETNLFGAETVLEWRSQCALAKFCMDHGLVRIVAELFYRKQTPTTVLAARGWLRRRSHLSTGTLLEILARAVRPRVLVDKSPSIVYRADRLRRLREMFPHARYIHLLRHPRGHGESVLKYFDVERRLRPMDEGHWLIHLAAFSKEEVSDVVGDVPPSMVKPLDGGVDPQRAWYALNLNIVRFLKSVPDWQKLCVRGEDVVSDPDRLLPGICRWLGIRDDLEAVKQMKHPERSPYASIGPRGARFGNDVLFLQSPELRPGRVASLSLDGPMPWSRFGEEFAPEVKQLATELGYG
jgi:hypothetical protein